MPIPDFQTVMLPLLVHLSDGKEHSNQETLKNLAEHFQLNRERLAVFLLKALNVKFRDLIPSEPLVGLKPQSTDIKGR